MTSRKIDDRTESCAATRVPSALVTDPPALLRSDNVGIVVSRALNG